MKFKLDNYNKYKNNKVEYDGILFDSKKEAKRYAELKLLERTGRIKELRRQVPFTLIPKILDQNGKCIQRACKYYADFVYKLNGKLVVEDTKGVRTAEYKIKKKLMLYQHNIIIKEI